MILVDTGAELSAAPWAFASQAELSPAPPDLQLRNADGKAIQIFGLRTLQLFSQGVSFTMTFVIASVETPLLGLGSLLQENMCLHFDPLLGHQLVTTEGERMQLVQCGNQVYLPAFHRQLLSSSSMIGALYSLVPEDELGQLAYNLGEHKEVPKKGGVGEEEPSFTLDLGHQKKQENKPAIGQQQLALPKLRRTQNKRGQQQVDSKLRTWQQLRFKEKMQLALLEEPRVLEKEASLDLSLRIILLVSLMNKWQLATTRIQPACQEQLKIGHLRELGLIQSNLCFEIFHGDKLCVFLDESCILIGGAKDQQECFLHKLSAKIPLTDTVQLDQGTSLTFQGKSLKYDQATRSISLSLPKAFYQQLLSRYNLQDATALDMPMQELVSEASRWPASILDASRTKLYKMTVGELVWLNQLRPDIGFAVTSLRQSLRHPTTHDEEKLCSLLRYLLGTQQHGVSLHLPKRWGRAKELELLAFSSTTWGKACGNIVGSSLALMGIPLAASTNSQATKATAEVSSVQLVCAQACHTRILLTELELAKPMFFRVLVGNQVSRKLGLSTRNKHTELWSRMGQFQVSKVASHKNLAEQLTYNLGSSSFKRMLTKLRVHHQPAEMQALPTRLSGAEVAFFLGSPPSFYIGMLTKHPAQLDLSELEQDAMEELCALQLCTEQLPGKESEEQFDLPKLHSAYATQLDLEQLERIDLDQLEGDQLSSLDLDKLERDELQTEYANQLLGKELENSATIPELQIPLQKKTASTLISLELDVFDSSTRAWDPQLEAYIGSTRASASQQQLHPAKPSGGDWVASASALRSTSTKKRTRASYSLNSTSLFSIFLAIFMIGSLTLSNLSLQSSNRSLTNTSLSLQQVLGNESLQCTMSFQQLVGIQPQSTTSSFSNLWGQELVNEKENLKLVTLLWEQELAELMVENSCPLDLLYDHLGQDHLEKVQLQQNLLENDSKKKLENRELEKKNFDKNFQSLIYEKLVALLSKRHFALAASTQLLGNEAWKKFREASQISFDKVGDKELLQDQLRRQELGYKDLWPAYLWALCPNSFEKNTFPEETFANTSLGKETFTESSLTKSSFTESSLTKSSFTESSLTKSSFTEHSFLENTFLKNSFSKTRFDKKTFLQKSFDQKSFAKTTFQEKSFDKSSLGETSLEESSLQESSLERSSLQESSLVESSFFESSFPETRFQSSFRDSSFQKSSFQEPSFPTDSFKKNSLAQKSFHWSSFTQSSLEESSLTKSSFQKSSLPAHSFNESSFEEKSFNSSSFEESSFQKSSFDEKSFDESSFSTELAKLERRSLRTELGQLDALAFKKAALHLETSFQSKLPLGGPELETALAQGGVLRGSLLTSLYQLDSAWPCFNVWLKPACFHCKRKLLPAPSLAFFVILFCVDSIHAGGRYKAHQNQGNRIYHRTLCSLFLIPFGKEKFSTEADWCMISLSHLQSSEDQISALGKWGRTQMGLDGFNLILTALPGYGLHPSETHDIKGFRPDFNWTFTGVHGIWLNSD